MRLQYLDVSAANNLVAVAGGNYVGLWNSVSRREIRTLSVGEDEVTCLKFSPDGRFLAEVVPDNRPGQPVLQIRVWRIADGKRCPPIDLSALKGRLEAPGVTCLAFSADARLLAVGNDTDATIHLWEVASGRLRGVLSGHRLPVTALEFSPDGKRLASGSLDATVLIWDRTVPPRKSEFTASELANLWENLGSPDDTRLAETIRSLTRAGRQGVTLLKEQLRPVRGPSAEDLARLIRDLDSDRYAVRQKAMRELERLRELAEPALRRTLQERPSLEVRQRVEGLLKKGEGVLRATPEQLRELRGLEVLEGAGFPEALTVVEALSRGAPGALLTEEARAALARMNRSRGR